MPRNTKSVSSLENVKTALLQATFEGHLPCREAEYKDCMQKVSTALASTGGSIYISGVPGTGKTATVLQVIAELRKKKRSFVLLSINGMCLVDPTQAYTEIYKQMINNKVLHSGKRKVGFDAMLSELDEYFKGDGTRRKPILLFVDEVDMLRTRNQDILYKLFDWACNAEAGLTVLAIANTLDLPERIFSKRVSSRMGMTRIQFQPYSHEQLPIILRCRLGNEYKQAVDDKAFEFIARRVASINGDLRKAIDLLKMAVEFAIENNAKRLTLAHVTGLDKKLKESSLGKLVNSLRLHERLVLLAVLRSSRASIDSTTNIRSTALEYLSACKDEDVEGQPYDTFLVTLTRLSETRLYLINSSVKQNVSSTIIVNADIDKLDILLQATLGKSN